jgi:hypothetical protein
MELTNSSILDVTPHETRQEDAETNPQDEYANGQSKYICLYFIAYVCTKG